VRAWRGSVIVITLKTLLVPTDFSESAATAVEQGRALATSFDAVLHVLSVVTEPLHKPWVTYAVASEFVPLVERLCADTDAHVRTLLPPDEIATGRIVVATAWGSPADEILKYARIHRVDLIVCGTHGHRGWHRFVLGSVAECVVRLAPCPVLTVHARRAAA
jgi:nucleotide-binding universal stress UspA family protein